MQGAGTALKLNLKIGIGLMIAFVMIMSGMTEIMTESGLNDSVSVSASGINNPTPTNTGCNVSYSQSSLQGNQIIANYTGDYLQTVNAGYYIVTMACTNHNSNVFLSLNYNGMQTMQNSTYSIAQMGVNTSNGNGVIQMINFYWHDGTSHNSGVIALIVNSTNSNGQNSGSSNTLDTTPRVSMWPGKVNQHNWNGIWMTDPDGKSGGHPSTSYSNDYGDRKVDYCQKWWPNTYAVQLMPLRETITFYTAGNAVAYVSTKDVYECLIGNGTTPPAGNGTLPGSGNNTNPNNGNGTTPPVGNGTLPGSGNNTNPSGGNTSGNNTSNCGSDSSLTDLMIRTDSNTYTVGDTIQIEWYVNCTVLGQYYTIDSFIHDGASLVYGGSPWFGWSAQWNPIYFDDYISNLGAGNYCFNATLYDSGVFVEYEETCFTVVNGASNNSGNNTNGNPPILLVNSDLPEEIEQTGNEKLLNSGLEALSEVIEDLSLEQDAVLVSAGVGMTSFSLIGLISRYFSKGII
jgi:hypothetical protein